MIHVRKWNNGYLTPSGYYKDGLRQMAPIYCLNENIVDYFIYEAKDFAQRVICNFE